MHHKYTHTSALHLPKIKKQNAVWSTYRTKHLLRSEKNYQESILFFDQDPGIELGWLGLVASVFTHWAISLVHKDTL